MKFYSIKRLFYLDISVKIHFFKLLQFAYFPKSTFQSISNFFNLCLYSFFKFKPDIDYFELENEREMMSEF